MDKVILVDEQDNALGVMDKMQAHHEGLLHRAFSVLLFNSKGELLLQKRARGKYHSGGLWTNTCCSHPQPGEDIALATRKRLSFEMGIDAEPKFAYKFLYRVPLDMNLIEHELDYVFTGTFDGVPAVNPAEVEDWKYISLADLRSDMESHPDRYTEWFRIIVNHAQFRQPAVELRQE